MEIVQYLRLHRKAYRLGAIIGLMTISLSTVLWALPNPSISSTGAHEKKTVGQTAQIELDNAATVNLRFLSRVDTGAAVTSLHAMDIQSTSPDEPLHASIGQMIRFKTCNESNQCQVLEKRVVDVVSVRNAQGVEDRYVIELDLIWKNFSKRVSVNLRDRSKMHYKLLLGRNWMHRDVVVDVDINEGVIQ